MLKKKYRLSAGKLNKPKTEVFPYITVKSSENGLGYPRFGFVVSKSVDPRAVVRNRTKRVFRSCIEELLPSLKIGKDFLFIFKSQTKDAKREELLNLLKKIFKDL